MMFTRHSGPPLRCAGTMLAIVTIALSAASHSGYAATLKSLGRMHELRASHTATPLPTGKVLIAGGFKKVRTYDQAYFNTAELYDPHTGQFEPTGVMHVARCGHTATLLQNGKVLIAGGGNDNPLSSAELYDPQTGSFTVLADMGVPREGHTATLLRNGNVLLAGGTGDPAHGAEIFNVGTQRFQPAGRLTSNRIAHTATLLADGKVLICGGTTSEGRDRTVLATAELYDPEEGTFSATGSMSVVRYKHGALLLPDGTVLIVGGSDAHDWKRQYRSAELYDPRGGKFSAIPDMQGMRFKLPNGVTLLRDGTVLVSGGGKKAEIYNPKTQVFTTVAEFDEPHFYQTATLLPDGAVLIAGGYNAEPQSTDRAWVYQLTAR